MPAPHHYAASGPCRVREELEVWHDERRQRPIPCRHYLPQGVARTPLILFSHGLGGDRDNGERWLRHWVSHGYRGLALQHAGSDAAVMAGSPMALRRALTAATTPEQSLARLADLGFVLDEVWRRQAVDPAWAGVDLERVGLAGHSYGAVTTQAMAGERRTYGPPVAEPRLRAFLGAAAFAAFSVLWTSMAFLLAGPAYGFSEVTIGLFGLAGVAGALAASAVGHLADRGHGDRATTLGWWLLLLSWGALYFAPLSLVALILGVLALDLAVQGVHVSNQGAIYRIRPEARNRLTAAYMTCYFIGGAAGSLVSAAAYGAAGWSGVCLCGGIVSLAGLAAWLGGSRLHKAVSGA